jgi:hypothetical protein
LSITEGVKGAFVRGFLPAARVRCGSNSEVELADADFRFAPESGLKPDIGPCPFRADIVAKVFFG